MAEYLSSLRRFFRLRSGKDERIAKGEVDMGSDTSQRGGNPAPGRTKDGQESAIKPGSGSATSTDNKPAGGQSATTGGTESATR